MRGLAAAVALVATAMSAAAASITASPAVINGTTGDVTIAWAGLSNPQSNDWIAAYCVGASVGSFGPWTYVNVCSAWATGSCSLSLTVSFDGMGCSTVEFRLYRDPSPYTLEGTSNSVRFQGGNSSIRHVHIAYGTRPQTEMFLSFTTDDGITPALVQLGTFPGQYSQNFSAGEALTYLASDSCLPPSGWTFPGFFHHTLLTGLQPATRYYARPVQGGSLGAETSFLTGKPVGAGVATQFVVYADMDVSGGTGAVETAQRVLARVPQNDFLLHVGDLGYGEGNVARWSTWMSLIEPVASQLPYHVSIGNHEYDSQGGDASKDPSGAPQWHPIFGNEGNDSGGECGMPTARRFRTPATGNGVFWYSFEVGNVHIAMVSSEHDPSPGAPMGDWLIADLAAVDRSVTPWLLVGIHRPLVETEDYPGDFLMAAGLRGIMEPYLLRYGVDVVLAGHYHSFQRSCAMANLTCVPSGGIVHYTTGAAGASLDVIDVLPSTYIEKTILGQFGYSIVSAPNASALRLTFYENQNDTVADDVWITKP